ncbi:MAG: hypothetical protein ACOZNI_37555, partial [Myxococcota bacterium]
GAAGADPTPQDVCAVLGEPVPDGLPTAALTGVAQAVASALARRAAGKATPDDASLLLRFVPPSLADAGPAAAGAAVARDPDAAMAILPDLSRWVEVKDLTAAGVDGGLAKRLLEPTTGLAAAGALADALRELRRWDVLSLLCAALVAPGDGKRGIVVPRGGPGRATVVAVGLGRLRAEALRKSGDVSAVDQTWHDVARATRAVATDLGHAGLLVFEDAIDALRFSLTAGVRLGGPVPVGIGHGTLVGGTDGDVVRAAGPAVDNALRWMAASPAPARPGGGLSAGAGVQQLAHVGGWLCGSGVGVDTAAEEALQEARMRRGLATALDGPPAGDPRVPRSLDLHRAFEFDGEVVAVVRIAGVAGGFEVLHMPVGEWRALLDRDGEMSAEPASPRRTIPPEPPVAPSPEPAVAGEADGWEAAEPDEPSEAAPVVLDLEENSSPHVLPDPGDAFDTAHEDFETEEERRPADGDPVTTGFFLPGVDATGEPEAPVAAPPPSRPSSPSFDMEVVDDEEDEEEPPQPDAFALPVDEPAPPPRPTHATIIPDDDDPFASEAPYGAGDAAVDTGFFVGAPGVAPEEATSEPVAPPPSMASKFTAPPPLDPFHDAQVRPEGDPFAREARAAAGPAVGDDPFAQTNPFAQGDGDDPFSHAKPDEARRKDDGDPFAAGRAPADPDPFAGFEAGGVLGLGGTGADDAFAEPDPFTQDEPRPGEAVPPSFSEAFAPTHFPAPGRAPDPPAAAPPAPPPPAKKPATSKPSAGAPTIDFEYLLRGYAWFAEGGHAVFGRPYGARMVDRHSYPYGGDPDAVYLTFLRDKIAEGFVPRTELMGDVPAGASLQPLETERLARAWSRLS